MCPVRVRRSFPVARSCSLLNVFFFFLRKRGVGREEKEVSIFFFQTKKKRGKNGGVGGKSYPDLDRPVRRTGSKPLVRDRVDRQRPHPAQVSRNDTVVAPVRVPLGARPLGRHPARKLVEGGRGRSRGGRSRSRSLNRWRGDGEERGRRLLRLPYCRPCCCCCSCLCCCSSGDRVNDAARGGL